MIILKLFCVLVGLLQVPSAVAFNHTIDLNRCTKGETACFLPISCIQHQTSDNVLVYYDREIWENYSNKLFEDLTCHVIVQIKPFSSQKWHVMMQVTGTNLIAAEGIRFTQGQTQFSCKPGMKALEGELNPREFGGGHTFSSESMFCSIIIETIPGTIADTFTHNSNNPILSYYKDGQEQKVEYVNEVEAFWTMPEAICNVDLVRSKTLISNNKEILHEMDTTLNKMSNMDCMRDHPGSYLMVHQRGGYFHVEDIYCETEGQNKGTYQYRGLWNSDLTLDNTAPFEVFCVEELCTKCDDFVFNKDCPGCADGISRRTSSIDYRPVGCKKASCPGDKWRLSNGSVITSTVECRQSIGEKAGWFRDGESEEITEGSCAETICSQCSDFVFNKDCPGCVSGHSGMSGHCKTASCPADKWRLSNGSVITSTVECRQTIGEKAGWFRDGESEEITEGSCAEHYDCFLYSKLNLDCPAATDDCRKVIVSDDKMTLSCPGGFEIRYGARTATSLTCDGSSGHYLDTLHTINRDKIQRESHVYCQIKQESPVEDAALPAATLTIVQLVLILVVVVLLTVLIVLILAVLWCTASRARPAPKEARSEVTSVEEDSSI